MSQLEICNNQIPKFSDLNKILKNKTGFTIVPVKGFIPEDLFFKFLSERKFPSTCFIRQPNQLDYLEEPDMFHDIFGHIPLFMNQDYADFAQKIGALASHWKHDIQKIEKIQRLYWFTVEFGVIRRERKIKSYKSKECLKNY